MSAAASLRRRGLIALGAAGLLALLAAAPASALTIDPNPRTFDNGAVSGTITLVGTANGLPAGGEVLAGAVGVSDITLIFEAFVATGSIDSIGVGVFQPPFTGLFSTGAGRIANGGVDIASVGGTAGTRIFNFDGNLNANETSDLFFVSYASLAVDGSQVVNFMVSPADGSSDFTVSSTILPEPSALLLLGLGATGLAVASRRRAATHG